MTHHPFTPVPLKSGASFLFTPCPGTQGSELEAAVATLATAGATAVITALPTEEIDALKVSTLGQQITQSGMQWFQLPIEDDQAPAADFFDVFSHARDTLLSLLNNKATIAIHCRGGSGRTGLIAAILLLESGMTWAEVKALIQAVRPKALTLPVHTQFLQTHYAL